MRIIYLILVFFTALTCAKKYRYYTPKRSEEVGQDYDTFTDADYNSYDDYVFDWDQIGRSNIFN